MKPVDSSEHFSMEWLNWLLLLSNVGHSGKILLGENVFYVRNQGPMFPKLLYPKQRPELGDRTRTDKSSTFEMTPVNCSIINIELNDSYVGS